MKVFSPDYLRRVGTDIFIACGSPPPEAALVADDLVESNLLGYDSHGVIRCETYVEFVLTGQVKPGAPLRVVKETPITAVLDCGLNFGQVSATRMVEIACAKAKQSGMAYVISKNGCHVGRLGSYVQKITKQGMLGMATCNNRKIGHVVAPWGAREGRLGTNPLAFAAPTKGWPMIIDMSTCMIAEGKVFLARDEGKSIPPGCLQDAAGNPTTDPNVYFGPPHGTLLPFGSQFGYKGFGLSLMVEILGGIMAGEDPTVHQPGFNSFSLIAINPDAFYGAERFVELVDRLCAYQMSAAPAPGFQEVVVPGIYDFRMRQKRLATGIPVDNNVWNKIVLAAQSVGVVIHEPSEDRSAQEPSSFKMAPHVKVGTPTKILRKQN
jgi:hydroxycarboxylate dehydrogenase B